MSSSILELGGANLPPNCCLLCAGAPIDETKDDHPMYPFIVAVGMDVNWGESVYICWLCAGIIADLVDRPSAEKFAAVLRGAKLQKKHNEKLVKVNEELRQVVRGMLDGAEVTEKAKELMADGK